MKHIIIIIMNFLIFPIQIFKNYLLKYYYYYINIYLYNYFNGINILNKNYNYL